MLYPRSRVLTIVPFFFIWFMWLPAWIVLGYFFVGQFLLGAASSIAVRGGTASGVAVWAHVRGFLAGMLLVKLFPARARRYDSTAGSSTSDKMLEPAASAPSRALITNPLIISGFVCFSVLAYIYFPESIDDAYITLRYAPEPLRRAWTSLQYR